MRGLLAPAVLLLGTAQLGIAGGFRPQGELLSKRSVLATRDSLTDPSKQKPAQDNYTDAQFDKNVPFKESVYNQVTGVLEAHRQGHTGKGIRIAVIDTGVASDHPALKGKVVFGYDFVGHNLNYGDPYRPGPSAETNCSYHGTLTTATIVGDDPQNGYVGVAPGATVEHYKISGCDTDVRGIEFGAVEQALKMAVSRKVDIISVSLSGGAGPYPEGELAAAYAAAAGDDEIMVVASTANNGANGTFSSQQTSAAAGVLHVGSSTPLVQIPVSWTRGILKSDKGTQDVGYFGFGGPMFWPETDVPLCPLTTDINEVDVACNGSKLLAGKKFDPNCGVLIRQASNCDDADQLQNLYDAGARMALIWANDSSQTKGEPYNYGEAIDFFPNVVGLSEHTGIQILSRAAKGEKFAFSFDPKLKRKVFGDFVPLYKINDGGVSWFTSFGPDGDLSSTPSMIATGGAWAPIAFGSSFAAPYMAGAAALVMEKYPGLKPSQIRRRLIHSAKPLKFHDGTNKTYTTKETVFRQGSGRLDMMEALNLQTDLMVESLSFNDTQFFSGKTSFKICNIGKDAAQYKIAHIAAQTLTAYSKKNPLRYAPWNSDFTRVPDANFLSTLVDPTAHLTDDFKDGTTIGAGQCVTVNIKADVSSLKSLEAMCPLYSGWLKVSSSRQETLHLAYSGVGCRMNDHSPLSDGNAHNYLSGMNLRAASGGGQKIDETVYANPIEGSRKFTVPKFPAITESDHKDRWNDFKTQFPVLAVEPATYVRHDKLSVIPSSKHLTGAEVKKATAMPFAPVVVRKSYAAGHNDHHQDTYAWGGELQDGSFAPEGSYVFRYCASRFWSSSPFDVCITTEPFELAYES